MYTSIKRLGNSAIAMLIALLLLPSVNMAQTSPRVKVPVKVDVVYFHAPNRCPTCVATEKNTQQFLAKHFKAEMGKGQVSFQSLDLKAEENGKLVEKYEIVFPTLLILKKQGGKEIKTDFSTTAFQYAYAEPKKYEALLKSEIIKNLK